MRATKTHATSDPPALSPAMAPYTSSSTCPSSPTRVVDTASTDVFTTSSTQVSQTPSLLLVDDNLLLIRACPYWDVEITSLQLVQGDCPPTTTTTTTTTTRHVANSVLRIFWIRPGCGDSKSPTGRIRGLPPVSAGSHRRLHPPQRTSQPGASARCPVPPKARSHSAPAEHHHPDDEAVVRSWR